MRFSTTFGINPSFPGLFRTRGQIAHALLTLSPLIGPLRGLTVRLACLIHAASVHSEPGSNSPLQKFKPPKWLYFFVLSMFDFAFAISHLTSRQTALRPSASTRRSFIALFNSQRAHKTTRNSFSDWNLGFRCGSLLYPDLLTLQPGLITFS
jgi:hypothetical protein